MKSVREWRFQDVLVKEVRKCHHRSKDYFRIIRACKDQSIQPAPLKEALNFFLTSEMLPEKERATIQAFTVFCDDHIICLHSRWARTIYSLRTQIFQQLGWYPYVTGQFLDESTISQTTDTWLGDRDFNELDFANFEVTTIQLESVAQSNGAALLLRFNDFKILLDCCFDLDNPQNCLLHETPDLIFISHAHHDHYGSLLPLIAQLDRIPLIMSYTTLDLISYFKQNQPSLQTYLRANAYPLTFDDVYPINESLSLQILKAGHYPGAAMLYLATPNHRILFTGDLFLHDLQPFKGGATGIHNLNGPLHSLIIDGQFCNLSFPSQKLLLDKACAKAIKTLDNGGPVLVLGDPGSWLLVFYLKLFYYLFQIDKRFRVYLDSHTLEIMKILRYRQEDITPFLAQRILRFHDPFASIIRQNQEEFDSATHSPQDPPIILFNSNQYEDPPPPLLTNILDNPKALLIVTGPIRTRPLQRLWDTLTYNDAAPKPLQCELFGYSGNPKHPEFSLHPDKSQIIEAMHHLTPPHIYFFHNTPSNITSFQNFYASHLTQQYPNIQIHPLELNAHFTLYDATSPPPLEQDEYEARFFPLIKTLEIAHQSGYPEVSSSLLSQFLTSKFPYWKEKLGFSRISTYLDEAIAAEIICVRSEGSQLLIKLNRP